MLALKRFLAKFSRDEDGASLVEYALLVALIAVAAIVALTTLGGDIAALFNSVSGNIANVTP